MDCVNCGAEARYNRAVIDLYDSETLGGYCSECESQLEESLTRSGEDTATCEECSRFGRYALAEHHIEVSIEDGQECVSEGYDVIEETPRFCERHAPLRKVTEPAVDREQQRLVDTS